MTDALPPEFSPPSKVESPRLSEASSESKMPESRTSRSKSKRGLPAVDKILDQLDPLALPRPVVVSVIRKELDALRAAPQIPETREILSLIQAAVEKTWHRRIQPVINATGVLIHTNLGRSPVGPSVLEAMRELASQYGNLEYDLVTGKRGGRAAYLENNLALLCGSEGATVVNNNAAALVLVLKHLCRGDRREVVISRGELVQIGGGFRIPEILEVSGATLREVGATNQTSYEDYSKAISSSTALLLKVHRSNFYMDGFVQSPTTSQLAALAHQHQIPLVEDLGSGAVVPTENFHESLMHEPSPAESLRQGVDLVTFSGDKLFGGPQAGLLAGRKPLIASLKREPLFRALRCDKFVLMALQTLVDNYLRGPKQTASEAPSRDPMVPLHEMMSTTTDQLRERANRVVRALVDSPCQVEIQDGESCVGGGSMPRSAIPSVVVALRSDHFEPARLTRRLRMSKIPVVGYVHANQVCLNLRTVLPWQDLELITSLQEAVGD